MGKQLAFYVDLGACVGCKVCQIACKDKNNLPVGILWRKVIEYGGGSWELKDGCMIPQNVFSYFVPVSCNHCTNPVCAEVCPDEAISKRKKDGIVLIDTDLCTGCWECLKACPYGVPQKDADSGYMTKCDFCHDLIDENKNPVCVDACPMRAIHYGNLDELKAEFGEVNAVEPLPASDTTGPSLILTPHRHSLMSGTGSGRILNLEGEL